MTRPLALSIYASRVARAVAGTVGSQAVAFLAIPFVFRLYAPAEFGLWAGLQAATLMLCALSTLRLEFTLVKEPDRERAGQLFWVCLVGGSGLGLILGLGVWTASAALRRPILTAEDGLLALLWLESQIANAVLVNWLLRAGRFARGSSAVFANGLIANLVQIAAAAWAGDHRHGLLIGSVAGQIAAVALLALGLGREPPSGPSWRPRIWFDAVSRHRRFALYTLPYTLLVQARERAALFVLGAFGSAADVGRYSQAFRLTGLPGMLSGAAFRPVAFQEAAREGLAEVEPLVLNMMALVVAAVAPALGVLLAAPTDLFGSVLGPAWRGAGPLAAALAPSAFLYALTNWMDRLFDVDDRHEVNLQVEVATALVSIGAFWATLARRDSILDAALVQGVVLVLAYLAKAVLVFRLSRFQLARLGALLAWGLGLGAVGWTATTIGRGVFGSSPGLAVGLAAALALTAASAAVLARRNLHGRRSGLGA